MKTMSAFLLLLAVVSTSCMLEGALPEEADFADGEYLDDSSQALATGASAFFWTADVMTRECGANAVYAGPNRADLHGGTCLFFSDSVFRMHTSYTTTKDCGTGVYLGPNRADEHGGTCLWMQGYNVQTSYTMTKSCPSGGVYVGPNRPDLHGGVCLRLL